MDSKEKRRLSKEVYEKRNKELRKEKVHEAMQRCRERIKAMPLAQQEAVKAQQQASQAKYWKVNREKLYLKADSQRWMSFMAKYENNPSQMPDDRTHRRGHIYHPEDYSPHKT